MSEDKFIVRVSSKSDLENRLVFTGPNNIAYLGNDQYVTAGIGHEVDNGSDDSSSGSDDPPVPPTPPDPPVPPTPTEWWGLTFTAEEARSTISMISVDYEDELPKLQTSVDGGETWVPFVIDETIITLANVGDKVLFAATDEGNTYFNKIIGDAYTVDSYNKFVMTGKIAASGDVTSLLNNKTSVDDISNMPAVFGKLFYECTSLTTPPELPSTIISNNCYDGMFYGCSLLTVAPDLPAMNLKSYCYNEMFRECDSITKIVLPAVELVDHCYRQLFNGYDENMQLNDITVGFTDWKGDEGIDPTYEWMFGLSESAPGTFRCPTALGTNETISRSLNNCPPAWTVVNID